MTDLVYKEDSYRIMGACFEVYKEKGCGFLEPVYQECMEIELALQGIQFIPKRSLSLSYKGRVLKNTYEPDFICFDKIVLELKAAVALADEHRAQVSHRVQTWIAGKLRSSSHAGMGTCRKHARQQPWPSDHAGNKEKSRIFPGRADQRHNRI